MLLKGHGEGVPLNILVHHILYLHQRGELIWERMSSVYSAGIDSGPAGA